jgi:hypothetical protein
VPFGKKLLTFGNMEGPWTVLDREDPSSTIPQNARNYMPDVTAQNTRRLESPDFKRLMQFGYVRQYEISQIACFSIKFFTVPLTKLSVVQTAW